MKDKVFIDTNILVYLYSEDRKSKKAESIINNNFDYSIISTQVLNELFNVLAIKTKIKTKEESRKIISTLINSFEIALITNELVLDAIDISIKYQYRFFDSLMIAVALNENCNKFYSEDLHHGHVIDEQLTIINPFI